MERSLGTPAQQRPEVMQSGLKDLEVHIATRKYVPTTDSNHKHLEGIIERQSASLRAYYLEHCDNFSEHDVDFGLVSRLCYSSTDHPVAKRNLSAILVKKMQRDNQEALAQAPDDRDLQAQRNILDIWQTLQSENIKNEAVEDAVFKALPFRIQSHSQNNVQPSRRLARGTDIMKIPAASEAKPEPWSIRVECIILSGGEEFSSIDLVLNETTKHLDLHMDGRQLGPDLYIDLDSILGISHLTSIQLICIYHDRLTSFPTKIQVASSKDGNRLLDKIKSLQECEIFVE
ncbi:MAG: hypothetical protein Q9178_007876 [Gyalolechia marmorata]